MSIGLSHVSATAPLRGRDGTYRWFLSRALPIRDESGRIIRWFGTNTDITELQQAEAALAERNQELNSFAYPSSVTLVRAKWMNVQ